MNIKYIITSGFTLVFSILSYGNTKLEVLNSAISDDAIVLENTHFTHLIMYGQSLSAGGASVTSLSTENIPGNYMLGKQVWYNYGNTNTLEIHPLVGHPSFAYPTDLGEPPIMGAANHIQKKLGNLNIIATSVGVGSTSGCKGSQTILLEVMD